ncbi:MAG: CoA transferase, partial [Chloroflexi bacterium]|nr:CoA transferase [Chloroflexota bacterium]
MTETLQSFLPEAILEWTMLGREQPRVGNRHHWKAPHGVYRARGSDRWLAISVGSDAEWRGLCAAMGQPGLADDPRFADAARRHAAGAALDAIVEGWTRALSAAEAAERLQRAGVPASAVLNARDALADAHMVERSFVRDDEHPLTGRRPMAGAPWKVRDAAITYRHAPLLGEANDYVLRDLLGLGAEEIGRLEEARAIY